VAGEFRPLRGRQEGVNEMEGQSSRAEEIKRAAEAVGKIIYCLEEASYLAYRVGEELYPALDILREVEEGELDELRRELRRREVKPKDVIRDINKLLDKVEEVEDIADELKDLFKGAASAILPKSGGA